MIDLIVKEELDKDGNVVITKYQENAISIIDVTVLPETDNSVISKISANTFRDIVGEPVPDAEGNTQTFEDKAKGWLDSMKWVVGIF